MAEAKKPLGWFDLPPEVRNQIYKEVLITPFNHPGWSRSVAMSEETSSNHQEETSPEQEDTSPEQQEEELPSDGQEESWPEEPEYDEMPLSVQILRTSKRVYNEAVGFLYSESALNLSFVRRVWLPWPEWNEYHPYPDGGADGEGESGSFGLVALLVQHCPHIQEIEFDDLGLRGTNLAATGGVEHVLNAVQVLDSYLRTIPSLKKVTVWGNPCYHFDVWDLFRESRDVYWEPERRLEDAVENAGWVLMRRDCYRW
ncbi:uncharacterized protein PG986_013147 [Apiospora aurea]|uniref:DUF7730 domain-containing protein n=1 Tax=Apiospora aurea TaxID=335848 RepID=A0ABR1PVS7_9PEZI